MSQQRSVKLPGQSSHRYFPIPELILARKQLPTRGYAQLHPRLKDRLSMIDAGAKVLRIDEGKRAVTAVISTIDRDRVGDEVWPEGCVLTNYQLSPVWFFGHQSIPFPVGTADDGGKSPLAVTIEPGRRVLSTCYFHDKTLEAEQVFILVVHNIIRATSIGFNPLEEPEKLGEIDGNLYAGFAFKRWELLETSWVGVPANPHAGTSEVSEYRELVTAELSRNRVAGRPLVPGIRKALEVHCLPPKKWANGVALPTESRSSVEVDKRAILSAKDSKLLGTREIRGDRKELWNRSLSNLPTAAARRSMLAKWLTGLSLAELDSIVKKTEGYSGAHVYELAQFAKTLQEHDGLALSAAVKEALTKVSEQRELITQMQRQGGQWQHRGLKAMATAKNKRRKKEDVNSSSGSAGGYTDPPDGGEGQTPNVDHKRMKAAIAKVAKESEDAAGDGPHDFFYHPIKSEAYHCHAMDAHPEHLDAVKEDLEAIDGLTSVVQSPEPPPQDAKEYELVHKYAGASEPIAGPPQQTLSLTQLAQKAKTLSPKDKAALAKLLKEDEEEEQTREDESGSGLDPNDVANKEEEEEDSFLGGDDEPSDNPHHGANFAKEFMSHLQHAMVLCEDTAQHGEPEVGEHIQPFHDAIKEVHDAVRDWAGERYPEHEFSDEPEDETGDTEGDGSDEETSEGDLESWASDGDGKRHAPRHTKGKAPRVGKKHLTAIDEAASHLLELGGLADGSFGKMHRAASKLHAQELRGVHKTLAGDGAVPTGTDDNVGDGAAPTGDSTEVGDGAARISDKGFVDTLKTRNDNLDKLIYRLTGQRGGN